MPKILTDWSSPLGRMLLSLIFLFSGFGKITGWEQTTQYMAAKGMFAVPLFLLGAILFELVGGLMLLFGFRTRLGAVLLILFLIPTTLIFHYFPDYDGSEFRNQMIQFMKNLAIMGGLLVVVSHGAGPKSIDACMATKKLC